MPHEFVLPESFAEGEEGIVVAWFRREGAEVTEGEPLLEVQFAKVSSEVVAPISGRLYRILAPRDAVIKPGQVLALILHGGEDEPPEQPPVASAAPATPAEKPTFVPASPAARRLAREHGVDLSQVEGTEGEGRITEEDVRRHIAAQERPPAVDEIRASPIARRMAREHNIDLANVRGTGRGGRITEQDVSAAIEAGASVPDMQVESLSPMRRTIGQRMVESLHTMAQLTLVSEADVTNLVAVRGRLKQHFEVTYTDLIVQATALTLREHPRLNGRLVGQELQLFREINIGIAVAADAGLFVPVIHNVAQMDLPGIAAERKVLVERARNGQLTEQDMSGGTFTVTNLGTYGVDAFTPIINPPEIAILGVGRLFEAPVRLQGQLAWQDRVTLSLTFDHRVVDGVPAAQFLQSLCVRLAALGTRAGNA